MSIFNGTGMEEALDEKTSKVLEECEKRCLKSLELSNKNLKIFPINKYGIQHIQYLYLERNHLEELGEEFFPRLPLLKWLDVRQNNLHCLPSNMHTAKNLRNLLLEGNSLTHLPIEMGLLAGLSGLNLIGNPLVMPPQEIVACGAKVILKYLREQLAIEQKFGKMDLGEVVMDKEEYKGRREELFEDEQNTDPFGSGAGYSTNITNDLSLSTNDLGLSTNDLGLSTNDLGLSTNDNTPNITTEDLHLTKNDEATLNARQKNSSDQSLNCDPEDQPEMITSTMTCVTKKSSKNLGACNEKDIAKMSSEDKKPSATRVFIPKAGQKVASKKRLPVELSSDRKITSVENLSPSETNLIHKKSKEKRKQLNNNEDKKSRRVIKLANANSDKDIGRGDSYTTTKKMISPLKTTLRPSPRFEDLMINDMVALQLSNNHFVIPGQPSLGKIVMISDNYVTVHMYTGSFGGSWWPMMCRQSPYTREVSLNNVVHQFELNYENILFSKDVDILKGLCQR